MNGSWSVQLEDGPHAIYAELVQGAISAKLKVTWDGETIDTQNVFILADQALSSFQRSGHSFIVKHSGFGLFGKLVLSMDGALTTPGRAPAAIKPSPPLAAIRFLTEIGTQESEEIIGTEEYPLDNRFGDEVFTTARQVSRESTNELSVDNSNSLGGKISVDVFSAIKGEIEAQVSHQIGQKVGEKVTESQTLTFSVGPRSSVLYEVVWKRKIRTGTQVYESANGSVNVPYRVVYGLSCEVRTKASVAS
jgi:hypothetical protein